MARFTRAYPLPHLCVHVRPVEVLRDCREGLSVTEVSGTGSTVELMNYSSAKIIVQRDDYSWIVDPVDLVRQQVTIQGVSVNTREWLRWDNRRRAESDGAFKYVIISEHAASRSYAAAIASRSGRVAVIATTATPSATHTAHSSLSSSSPTAWWSHCVRGS
ncbi:hypothetical protein PC128_g23348 [Phytophthora cactorum]|nr:hypothetical protein PC128_g23348 [Phytophthora cactorum]